MTTEAGGKNTVTAEDFDHLLSVLTEVFPDRRVLCPVVEAGNGQYRPIKEVSKEARGTVRELVFGNRLPLGSVKSLLFPDSEIYLQYRRQGKTMKGEEVKTAAPQIIVGVKPCDLKGLELIDKVFSAPPADTLYQAHKAETVIIAAGCGAPGEGCSCTDFGIDPNTPRGADAVLFEGRDRKVVLQSASEKGDRLLEELTALPEFDASMEETVTKALTAEETLSKETSTEEVGEKAAFGKGTLQPEEIKDLMEELFDDDLWEILALRCIGCGTCTYYCPTCHCYDIQDFNRKDRGVRYRTWDSCMFSNFTNMAGDHNPRPDKADRIRNRFFHKLNYFVKKQGELACVGCGRCADHCPVGISINTVLKKIGGLPYVR